MTGDSQDMRHGDEEGRDGAPLEGGVVQPADRRLALLLQLPLLLTFQTRNHSAILAASQTENF